MNPNNVPVKFKKNTRVKVTQGGKAGEVGTVLEERENGFSTKVKLTVGGMILWLSDHEMSALPTPEVGDLVRIKASGRWQAHEGHVTKELDNGNLVVDVESDWNLPEFEKNQLEVIEKVKPKPVPVRVEGQPIKPEAIKRGDTISVVTVEDNEIKRTTIVEAIVDKIVPKSGGTVLHFQTRGGAHILTAGQHLKGVVSLVKSIDNDEDFQTLSQAKIGDVLSFADSAGEAETNLAVKREEDLWSVLEETKSRNVATVGLVNILKKRNVGYTVVRSAPVKEMPFPVGTNVRVKQGYSTSLSGDYRVIIAGDDQSTIKSRGISAMTHSVPSSWLVKDY
jgi:hypothetical protein